MAIQGNTPKLRRQSFRHTLFSQQKHHNFVGQYLSGILNGIVNRNKPRATNHFQRGTEASFGQPQGAEQL